MEITLYILGALTVLSAGAVVLSKKPLNSAIWLIITFCLLAANYVVLNATFIAVLQILIYAGAIMVLVIFVIMLLGSAADAKDSSPVFSYLFVLFLIACLAVGLGLMFISTNWSLNASVEVVSPAGIKVFGQLLFTKYVFAFELVGALILAATIGAVLLAQEPKRKLPAGRGLRAKQMEGEN